MGVFKICSKTDHDRYAGTTSSFPVFLVRNSFVKCFHSYIDVRVLGRSMWLDLKVVSQ